MKNLNLQFNKWYSLFEDSIYLEDIEEIELDEQFKGILYEFDNFEIDFDRSINVKGSSLERGRNQIVNRFMIISI